MQKNISADFPFQSKFTEVLDTTIHYVDINISDNSETTFLFIHGNPTSSYLWRNIIPYTVPLGRSVSLDLVGFGKSGKPDCDYSFHSHSNYLNSFIAQLQLKNIIPVIHDWGGALGFNYAMNNPADIRGVVFMETFCMPMEWKNLNFVTRNIFKQLRHPIKGQKWNGKYNVFLKFILQASVIRKLSAEERQKYFEPFPTVESRKSIVKFPQELPFKGEGTVNEKIADDYYQWLKASPIPKLLLYAKPGVQIQKKHVELYQNQFLNLTASFIGKGKHYIQEDQPDNIGEAIEQWFLLNF